MNGGASNIKVSTLQSKTSPASCVVVSIPYKANELVLQAVRGKHSLASLDNFFETLAFHAAVTGAFYKTSSRIQDVLKNKFLEMKHHVTGSSCTVSVTCAANRTAVKKTAKALIAALNPAAQYQYFAYACRKLGETPSRECFNHCADRLIKAMGDAEVLVVGKSVITDEEKRDLGKKLGELVGKYAAVDGAKKMVSPSKVQKVDLDMPILKYTPGVAGLVAKSYVKSSLKAPAVFSGDKLYVDSTQGKVDKLNDKDRISRFVKSLEKTAAKDPAALVFVAGKRCMGDVSALLSDAKSSMTKASLESMIKAALR